MSNLNNRDRGDRPAPEMHDATCSSCSKPCQVPFKPTSGKPVKCRDCFKSDSDDRGGDRGGRGGDRGGFKKSFGGDRGGDRKSFTPRPTVDYSADIKSISKKLDTIISLMEKMLPEKEQVVKPKDRQVDTQALTDTLSDVQAAIKNK